VPVSSQDLDFPFFEFSELRREVVIHFVDIGGIDDHHCLNFLFIITNYNNMNQPYSKTQSQKLNRQKMR
jgi:hypothetical protein